MKIKIVTDAKIRVVKKSQLKVGDEILYMCWRCRVSKIYYGGVEIYPLFDCSLKEKIHFLNYYVIEECTEIEEVIE